MRELSDLAPTPRLRFVEREVLDGKQMKVPVSRRVRILQQWWSEPVADYMRNSKDPGEWRDVPLALEVD